MKVWEESTKLSHKKWRKKDRCVNILSVNKWIRRRKEGWEAHINHKDPKKIVTISWNRSPEGRRSTEHPRKIWKSIVENRLPVTITWPNNNILSWILQDLSL